MFYESYFLELKKYDNKSIILDYQIEEITLEFFNTKIKTNKWIDFTVWLKIHEKLEKILNSNNLSDFSKEEFFISNNSIKIEIVKDILEMNLTNVFNIKYDQFQPFIIRVYIKYNKNDNIRDYNEYNPLTLTGTNENNFVPYKPSTKESKIEISKEINIENDPYSPKPIENDPYSPNSLGGNCDEISTEKSPDIFSEKGIVPKYKASPILHKSEKNGESIVPGNLFVIRKSQRSPKRRIIDVGHYHETRNKKRIMISRKQSSNCQNQNEEKKINSKTSELFGSDDSDVDIKSNSKRNARKNDSFKEDSKIVKKTGKKLLNNQLSEDSDNSNDKKLKSQHPIEEIKSNSNKWLNSNRIAHIDKNKINKLSKQNNDVGKKVNPIECLYSNPIKKMTEEERRLKREKHEREINVLNEFKNHVKQQNRSPPNIEFKSLNHISITNILKTFPKYKPLLDEHFHEYKSKKNHHIRLIEGLDHLALINVIDCQYEMLNCLRDTYEISTNVPRYTELFMTLMLPEWILALYMNEYKLTRANAIQRLKDQEDAKVCSQMDTSIFNFSTLEKLE